MPGRLWVVGNTEVQASALRQTDRHCDLHRENASQLPFGLHPSTLTQHQYPSSSHSQAVNAVSEIIIRIKHCAHITENTSRPFSRDHHACVASSMTAQIAAMSGFCLRHGFRHHDAASPAFKASPLSARITPRAVSRRNFAARALGVRVLDTWHVPLHHF